LRKVQPAPATDHTDTQIPPTVWSPTPPHSESKKAACKLCVL
jgi:hypothetical protein